MCMYEMPRRSRALPSLSRLPLRRPVGLAFSYKRIVLLWITRVITGYYVDSSNINHGFVRSTNGVFAEFDAASAGPGTLPYGINDAGAVTGYYLDVYFIAHGFVQPLRIDLVAAGEQEGAQANSARYKP